jgi:Family of unknown function (DUF5330)
MFFIRTIFVLAVGVMLLPTDEAQQAKVAGNAGAAAASAATFCERNPSTCAAGSEMWALFLKKAEFGARLAGSMAQDYMRGGAGQRNATAEVPGQRPIDQSLRPQAAPAKVIEPARGTLAPHDMGPAWRGALVRTGS